jgi:hypothetical protein
MNSDQKRGIKGVFGIKSDGCMPITRQFVISTGPDYKEYSEVFSIETWMSVRAVFPSPVKFFFLDYKS